MNRLATVLARCVFVCGVSAWPALTPASAAGVSYSGELTAYGAKASGPHTFRITPHSRRVGGERVAEPVTMYGVNVVDGRFKLALDFGAESASSDALWLGVEVASTDGAFVALPVREPVVATGTCWDTAGNSLTGGEFIGSTNDAPFEVRQNNTRAMQITYGVAGQYSGANSTIGTSNAITNSAGAWVAGGGSAIDASSFATITGGYNNFVNSGANFATVGGGTSNEIKAPWSTISGGDHNNVGSNTIGEMTIGGGGDNTVVSYQATIAGGAHNVARGAAAAICGGTFNNANGLYSSIAGGFQNTTINFGSMVPGGRGNIAGGDYSQAAGYYAIARHSGMYVWSDLADPGDQNFNPARTDLDADGTANGWNPASNTYSVRARGGVWFVTGLNGNLGIGAYLNRGSGAWAVSSSRDFKTRFEEVDVLGVLDAVLRLPVSYWHYKTEDSRVRHLGPFAEDFASAFNLGPDRQSITTVDADGVALAAIQGLNAKLEAELARLNSANAKLGSENADLRTRIERLENARADAPDDEPGRQ